MSNDVKGGWTPGPWFHAEPFRLLKSSKERGELYLRGIGNGSTHVGYASICPIHGNGEALANARLIAAAPELFEALVKAVEALENVNRHVGLLGGERGRLEQARAVIAKATGGTPTP